MGTLETHPGTRKTRDQVRAPLRQERTSWGRRSGDGRVDKTGRVEEVLRTDRKRYDYPHRGTGTSVRNWRHRGPPVRCRSRGDPLTLRVGPTHPGTAEAPRWRHRRVLTHGRSRQDPTDAPPPTGARRYTHCHLCSGRRTNVSTAVGEREVGTGVLRTHQPDHRHPLRPGLRGPDTRSDRLHEGPVVGDGQAERTRLPPPT